MSAAFCVCVAVTIVSSGVSLGYAVAGLRSATGSSRVPSMYALARSMALVVVAVAAAFTTAVPFAAAAALAMILVQALDAVVGRVTRDRTKTLGPAITSFVNAAALVWMLSL